MHSSTCLDYIVPSARDVLLSVGPTAVFGNINAVPYESQVNAHLSCERAEF